jgi:hypothetical protein
VDKLADLAPVLQDADPGDKAEIFRQLNLRLTYHPGRQLVEAKIEAPQHWYSDSVPFLPSAYGPSGYEHSDHDRAAAPSRWQRQLSRRPGRHRRPLTPSAGERVAGIIGPVPLN